MIAPRIPNSWPIRIGFFITGLGFIGVAPFLWRVAEEAAAPISSEASLSWQIASIASAAFGTLLVFAGVEYANPWKQFRRRLNTDNVTLAVMLGCLLALGSFAYFVLNERVAATCWRGPFEWMFVLSCPFYVIATVVAWVVTVAIGVLVYFGAVHHPILRALGSSQRSLIADDSDEYP